MTYDQETFRRGARAAIAGLSVQLVLALGSLVLALWMVSPATSAIAWHLFGGLPIWLILLLVYHQHRLERIEALETEQLAQTDAAAAAIFDERAQDLHVARKRLERFYKWGLSGVSLLVAIYLMAAGGFLLYFNATAAQRGMLEPTALRDGVGILPPLLSAIVMGLIAFLAARYVAGMTRVREWQMLRGGASYLMGCALLMVILAVGSVWNVLADGNMPIAVVALIVPAVSCIIGVEIVLSQLLSAYRPRRPGEMPRPAFESRLLAWTTSPESLGRIISDTINYQFGFEISRSWFYRLLSRAMTPLIVLGILSLIVISSIVIVEPHEQAIVTRFGAKLQYGAPQEDGSRTFAAQPGLHLKLPWPIDRVQKYEVERVQQIKVGSTRGRDGDDARDESHAQPDAILWTTSHIENERYLITNSASRAGRSGHDRRDPGVALIAAEVAVQYKIGNLDDYIAVARNDDQMRPILIALAEQCVMEYFATNHIDTLLSSGQVNAGSVLREMIQGRVDDLNLGLEIVFVGMAGVHPPQRDQVAQSFHRLISASQEVQSMINQARRDEARILAEVAGSVERANEIFDAIVALQEGRSANDEAMLDADEIEPAIRRLLEIEAEGEVARVIHTARADRWRRELSAIADAHSFHASLKAYEHAPQYYMQRAYFEALREHLPYTRLFVIDADQAKLPVYMFDFPESAGRIDDIFGRD